MAQLRDSQEGRLLLVIAAEFTLPLLFHLPLFSSGQDFDHHESKNHNPHDRDSHYRRPHPLPRVSFMSIQDFVIDRVTLAITKSQMALRTDHRRGWSRRVEVALDPVENFHGGDSTP